MLCISELRGLQEFQAKHPEVVLVSMSVYDDKGAIDKLIARQKLDTLHVAIGKEWQDKFGLSEAIPATVIVDQGRIRVIHDGVLLDPVAMLEADMIAIHGDPMLQKKN